jgi:pyridoxamine 5'-phosphate oxidase
MRMMSRCHDLASIERAVWRELEQAVQTGRSSGAPHPWRHAVLASQSPEGPQARTVVLRSVRADPRELIVYSDARAAKVQELREDPRAQLVCWSSALGWQLRLQGTARIETDGLDVTARWAAIRHRRAAQDYLAPRAPGAPLPDGLEPALQPLSTGDDDGPLLRRHHFAVIYLSIVRVDWLELHAEGHRRACLEAGTARWLTP